MKPRHDPRSRTAVEGQNMSKTMGFRSVSCRFSEIQRILILDWLKVWEMGNPPEIGNLDGIRL